MLSARQCNHSVDASQVVLVQSALMQYCTPAQQWNHSVDASQVVLVQSALMQYCTPAQQRNHFCGCQVHGSGAECSDAMLIS